jgi:lipoprotein-releasing system permease protein
MTMQAPLSWRIAVRYLRARGNNRFVSFISAVGIAGVAIGVAVLLVVLGVMNGFEQELKDRILAVAGHATISGLDVPIEDWETLAQRTAREAGVVAVAPYVETHALVAQGSHVSGVLVRGVDPKLEARVGALALHMVGGRLDALVPGRFGVVLGKALARELGVGLGDRVVVAAPEGIATPAGMMPRVRRLTVVGLVDSGLYEFDRGVALMALGDAQRLFRTGHGVTGLRLKLEDPFTAARTVRRIAIDLGGGFYIADWSREHENLFRSVATTKSIMFVLLLLVMAVAAFNIVATLVMMVREKRADIAILRTMGLTPGGVMAVFVLQGSTIGALGVAAGWLLGMAIAAELPTLVHGLEAVLHTTLVDPRIYLLDELPAVVTFMDVIRVCGTALVLSVLSTLYPAAMAARTQPAEALRHD